jgi:hypothetical protein
MTYSIAGCFTVGLQATVLHLEGVHGMGVHMDMDMNMCMAADTDMDSISECT